MICPIGKHYCDGCEWHNSFSTNPCTYIRTSYSITREEQDALYEKRYNELMSLSKETLVGIILGKRSDYL